MGFLTGGRNGHSYLLRIIFYKYPLLTIAYIISGYSP